jgi:hypothetical protein
MRGSTELIRVVRNRVLNQNSANIVSVEFPIAGFYRAVHLEAILTLTHVDGSGPVVDGEKIIFRNINLHTSNNEFIVKNCSGRGLYHFLASEINQLPRADAVAAATAVYRVDYPIYLSRPQGLKPDDTSLYSKRYSSLTLDINVGDVDDLLGTAGSDTVVVTLNVYVERFMDDRESIGRIATALREYAQPSPINPANQAFIDFERATNFSLERILIQTVTDAVAGKAFSGTPAGNVLDIVEFEIGGEINKKIYTDMDWNTLEGLATTWYQLAVLAGYAFMDFARGHSLTELLYSGANSLFRLTWTNDTLSTSQVSTLVCGTRRLNR